MIHYVYIGHFARQGGFIAFQKQPDGSLRPVVTRPVSATAFQHLLHEKGHTATTLPQEWGMWLDDGFVVCDLFTHSRDAIEVARRLATETRCDVADYSSQSLMSPDDLAFAWERPVQSAHIELQENAGEPIATADLGRHSGGG